MKLKRMIGEENTVLVAPSLLVEKVIPWTRAVELVLFRDAYTVLETDIILRSADFEMNQPLVVAHGTSYSRFERKFRSTDVVSKRMIKRRDNNTCQYCGAKPAGTIDHIIPKARGGGSTWGNMCVACKQCNFRKGSKSLEEMKYARPVIPDQLPERSVQTPLQRALFEALELAV